MEIYEHSSMKKFLFSVLFALIAASPLYAMKLGDKIPQFTLRDYSGALHRSDEFCGSSVKEPRFLIIDFFATWCKPCQRSIPILERLYKKHEKKGLRVVLIGFQEKEKTIRKFAEDHDMAFPILMDKYGEMAHALGVRGLPRTFIVKGDCTLIQQIIGERVNLEDILENEFTKLLQGDGDG